MKYRMMGLGLFVAAGLQQCQPACTPEPPPVVTTTTAAPNLNPLNIRWDGFACDEHQTMSGWSSYLAVVVRVGWPRVSTVYPSTEFHTFRDSTRVRVATRAT